MLRVLTDEECIADIDAKIVHAAECVADVVRTYPGTTIVALAEMLIRVNGHGWMSGTDMARMRLKAKELVKTRVAKDYPEEHLGSAREAKEGK